MHGRFKADESILWLRTSFIRCVRKHGMMMSMAHQLRRTSTATPKTICMYTVTVSEVETYSREHVPTYCRGGQSTRSSENTCRQRTKPSVWELPPRKKLHWWNSLYRQFQSYWGDRRQKLGIQTAISFNCVTRTESNVTKICQWKFQGKGIILFEQQKSDNRADRSVWSSPRMAWV